MSYAFYKILHLGALFISAMSLGGLLLFHSLRVKAERKSALRFLLLNLHGLSLFAAFVAGFGLIAKLGVNMPYPFWIYLKLGVFLALGAAPFLMRKYAAAIGEGARAFVLRLLIAFALLAALFILASFGGVYK